MVRLPQANKRLPDTSSVVFVVVVPDSLMFPRERQIHSCTHWGGLFKEAMFIFCTRNGSSLGFVHLDLFLA